MDVIIITLLACLFFTVYILFKEIEKQKKVKEKYKLDNSLNKRLLTRLGDDKKLDDSLNKRLLAMLGGDKKSALRLLRNVRKNNPGKTYIWYQEKVIRDLERDRRY